MEFREDIKFAEFIKQYREQNSLSLKELADMLLVSEKIVRQWENQGVEPSKSMKKKVLSILKIEDTEDYTYY
ncbi:multiprotein-bridging factor 1 family protein [candidate division CSSED10-310 bacterium]|uniref:Multiprotein-bridging factor 1 family protein n=1 Tax=candidate division CSSED10-310 bacterium TaxID=2855610 RepID=A0ABV6Z3L9_UNCC1